ncbi:HNH endonuclease [Streptomyces sp. NPDC096339]|uniref:HNH endonuclease n=1 Tax=Streptomyces sp. NPDC096339 TaxID=3366086 RepID=UPI0038180290
MTVHGVGRSEGEAAEEIGVQWLLQPRGTARVRGPQHFRHSVQNGIRLSEYEDVLGEDAAELRRIFPDGVARLWGATPPKAANNDKAKALRGRRVGDEVLFYAEKSFIARATVQGIFRNRALARKVWGEDDDEATWEHIVALGDVVEFRSDAMPLLAELNTPTKLWGLMLVSASDRLRLLDRVDIPSGWQPQAVTFPTPRSPRLGRRELLSALRTLRTSTQPQGPSRHKPLALLWAIGRVAAKEDRLAPWEVFEREVGPLLGEFGRSGSQVTPHYPFCRLRSSGVWEVEGVADGVDAAPRALREAGAKAGFVAEAARLLRGARIRAEAINVLCATYFGDVDRARLLAGTGLGGYLSASGATDENEVDGGSAGPVRRRPTRGMRPERDQELVRRVKNLHDATCQVCSEPLEVLAGYHSEAAHIQGIGAPHDGPDKLSNLLCLCPNHHAQFDRLAIYIDADWTVKRTRDGKVLFELRRHSQHVIGEEYIEYHRLLAQQGL